MNISNYNPTGSILKIITTVAVVALTIGAGILVLRLIGPIPLSVSQTLTEKQQTFDVTGDAEVNSIPDQAEIRLGIEVQESTVVAAQEKANRVTTDTIAAMGDLGIKKEDIRTENYSVYPRYDYTAPSQRITGYSVSSQLLVKVKDFDKINQIIDRATGLGVNQVGGVQFSLSETKRDELVTEARAEAIEDAKADAQELAKLAGIKLGKVVNITEFNNQPPQPYYMARSLEVAADAGGAGPETPTQIEPGTSSFTYQVTISYETL